MALDCIIIGAGAAGLAAAGALSRAGLSIEVLDARPRIGGRIHTVWDKALDIPIELGAEFVHGRPESTWKLLRESNLVAYDLPFDHFQRKRGRLVHLSNFEDQIGPVMKGLSRLGSKDISFADYLQTHARDPKLADARRLATAFVQGFDAADPELISAKSIAEEQEGLGDVDEEPQFRLMRGYGALINHMRASLPRHVRVTLGAPVQQVRWSKGRVTCELRSGRTVAARRAIITVPIGVLQAPPDAQGAIAFDPPVPGLAKALSGLKEGPVVKAILRFKEPFWEDDKVRRSAKAPEHLRNACFLQNPTALFPTFWTARPLHVPILTAWAGGPKAQALTGLSQRALIQSAIASLGDLFNLQPRDLTAKLETAYTYDWPADPFSRGAYSYVKVGGQHARAALAKPIQNTLFFAGEAADTSGQASTVAGALSSGQHAAALILGLRPKRSKKERTPPE